MAEDSAGAFVGPLAFGDDRDSVHNHVVEAARILVRLPERGVVLDPVRIKKHQIGGVAFPDESAVVQA